MREARYEWYTPPDFTDAAKEVMGSIDLDPASCELANEFVGASRFYSKEDDGLSKKWFGNVWLNPPHSRPLIDQFCNTAIDKWVSREYEQACILVNNFTDTKRFRLIADHAGAMCFVKGRITFIDTKGKPTRKPVQGQIIIYLGNEAKRFMGCFSKFGVVKEVWR